MRKALATTIAALIGGLTIASAQAAFSGNLGATSNYIWRGVTQTADEVGFSGGLDYAHDSGFYVGTWASNVVDGYELDGYVGFGGSIGDFGYDLNYTYFAYPAGGWGVDEDLDFGEAKATLSYSVLSAGVAYGTNAQDAAKAYDGSLYYFGDLSFELKEGLSLGFHIGSFNFEDEYSEGDYVDYNVSLTKTFALGDATFMISDTDIDEDDPKVVVSWSTGFDL